MIDRARLSEIYALYYLEGDSLVDELYDMVIELIDGCGAALQEASDMREDLADIGALKEEIDNLTSDLRDAEERAYRLENDLERLEGTDNS